MNNNTLIRQNCVICGIRPQSLKKIDSQGRRRYRAKCCHCYDNGKRRLKKFGITQKEYLEMFRSRNGKCDICGTSHLELTKGLFIDHDHVTGKVRGLLCVRCNSGIGLLGDNLVIMEKAICYLKENK